MSPRAAALLTAFGLAAWAPPAGATWSLVAVDPATGEVGAAAATCGKMVWFIAEVVPGRGAVVAQADTLLDGRDLGAEGLAAGLTPAEILDELTDPAFDPAFETRQYGVAALSGEAAAFTGAETEDVAISMGDGSLTVQGNLLTGAAVVEDSFAAFQDAEGLPMEERLMRGLEAGAAQGGDSRCPPERAAKSAFITVATEDGELRTWRDRGYGPPIEGLRAELDGSGCASAPGQGSGQRSWLWALAGLGVLRRRRRAA
jgi:MYXO-CTERM domain-containing protein